MATIISDTIAGSSLSISATDLSITRRIIIEGVTANNPYEKLLNAENDGLLPAIGDAYPVAGVGPVNPKFKLVCVSKQVTALSSSSNKQFEVVCQYEIANGSNMPALGQNDDPGVNGVYAQFSITGSLTTIQTNKLFGEATGAGTWGSTVEPIDLFRTGQTPVSKNLPNQSALVDIQVPTYTMKFVRNEVAFPASIGNHDALGYTNSVAFLWFDPKHVLFTNIDYEEIDASKDTYKTTYTFQALVDDEWSKDMIYIDPETNLPIAGATDDYTNDRTKVNYLAYRQENFNNWYLHPLATP